VTRARPPAGFAVAVLVGLAALAAGACHAPAEPTGPAGPPSTAAAPPPAAGPPESRPLAGAPLPRPARLRLLVAGDPAPFVVDLDRRGVRLVTGLPTGDDRVVSVLPVGDHALIVSERICTGCGPAGADIYGLRRGGTTAVRLGTAQEVAAAHDGRGAWLLGHRAATGCSLREVGLDGRPRRLGRAVACTTKLLGELAAGLLIAAGPSEDPWERPISLVDRRGHRTRLGFPAARLLAATGELVLAGAEAPGPLTLTDLASGTTRRLRWPSRLRGGTHIAAVHPTGRDIAVGFHGLPAPGEDGYDLWLLHTASGRWEHLPGFPAAGVAAKTTDMAWTRDGRLVVLTAATRGQLIAVWHPGQPRLEVRPVELPDPSPGTDTLAIW
jgi:hypothetical protein